MERDGSRGGRTGRATGDCAGDKVSVIIWAAGSEGDRAAVALAPPVSFACASNSRRVGGRGGSLAWSNAGGSLRSGLSVEDTLVEMERAEKLDRCDMSLELEPLLTGRCCIWPEGRRGGRDGLGERDDVCDDALRAGSGGAPFLCFEEDGRESGLLETRVEAL